LSYFAVKELKTRPIQGLNEVQSLMRFNEQPHEHLIRLLSTFVYKDSLHMIFHWADGNNLENFWVTTNAKPKEDIDFTRWMSKQISGLAEAIQRIHHCDNRLLSKSDKGKTHGRHGDLKPANILWFKHDPNNTNPESFGILKISDFGMADFHGPLSKSNVPASQVVGLTNGYRAPEFDNTRLISPRYDIWSFGCVLLEFAVWRTLDGYDGGINPFSVLRTKESTAVIPEDNFFNLRLDDKEEIIQAEAKPSVVSVSTT
jgi:serine/threonine protein kinase